MLFDKFQRRILRVHIAHPKLLPKHSYYQATVFRYQCTVCQKEIARVFMEWGELMRRYLLRGK